MTSYEFLMTLHIVAASVWVGGAAIYLVLHQYLHSRATRTEMFEVLHRTDRIAPFIFIPSILLTLTFGVLMVVTEDVWSFADLWISLGLGGLFVAFLLGFVSGVPMATDLTRTMERAGADAPEVTAKSQRILLIAYVEMALLAGVILVMVVKPGV